MTFQRSDVTEKFFFFELRLPGTSASFYAIPRSPLSPPLTRGPNQPANVPAAAESGGMRASRPTVARVVAAAPVGRASAMVRRGGPWPSRGTLRRRGVSGTMQASSPTLVCGIAGFVVSRLAAAFCLPCQREVARPKAVTEGLPYGGLTFERSGTPEWSPGRTMCAPTGGWRLAAGFVFSRRAAMFPAEHCGGAGCGGMRASRPTVARVVAVVPVGPKRKIYS